MINWLKTSIPGIIILGASGSIFAVAFLKMVVFFTDRYFKPAMNSLAGEVFVFLRSPRHVLDHLRTSSDIRELLVTCSLLLSQMIFMCMTLVVGFVTVISGAVLQYISSGAHVGIPLVFVGSMLTFSSIYFVRRIHSHISEVYQIHMTRPEDEATMKAEREYKEKMTVNTP